MARPLCPRRITHHPPCDFFKPAGIPLHRLDTVVLAPDELEALRLADVADLYHRDAARRLEVSRQTFDRIVRRARMKIAHALVLGKALRILRVAGPGGRGWPCENPGGHPGDASRKETAAVLRARRLAPLDSTPAPGREGRPARRKSRGKRPKSTG